MRSSAAKIKLTSVDDLFSSEESRADASRERVVELSLAEMHPFKNHPFKVLDDEKMQDTAESIREHGVLVPAIVRPREEGGYEIVAGHRRHFASQIAGLATMPAIVRDLDDDAATIIMVDSNLQRESILPSERAWAYRMKLEAVRRKAGRPSKENAGQLDPDFDNRRSNVIVAEQAGESVKQLQRFIRLTELIPPLLDMVAEFSKQKPLEEMTAALRRVYHGGSGIATEHGRVTAWYAEDGMHFATGGTARYTRTAQVLSWTDAAKRIGELLEEGRFATNIEVAAALGHERRRMAEGMVNLYWDTDAAAREQGYMATLAGMCDTTHPACVEAATKALADPALLPAMLDEYREFRAACKETPGLMRFRYRFIDELDALVDEYTIPRREFSSTMPEIPNVLPFITDDELAEAISHGSSFTSGKARIYEFFIQPHTPKEYADFLKKEYGIGGHSHAISGATYSDESYDGKGLHYKKCDCPDINLSWPQAVKRIQDLIRLDRYLTPQQKAELEAIREMHDVPTEIPDERILEVRDPDEINVEYARARLEEAGIVNGEVVDPEKLANAPIVRAVEAIAAELEQETDEPAALTDAEYAQQYLTPDETVFEIDGHTYMVDRVNLEAGTVNIQDITFSNAPTNVEKIIKLLRCAFKQAVRWELIAKNPFENAVLPRTRYKKRDIWDADTIRKALDACDNTRLYLAMNLAFACSLRMGEILGLTWDNVHITDADIAADDAWIYVDKEVARATQKAIDAIGEKDIYHIFEPVMKGTTTRIVLKRPKTESSIRKIWLPKTLAYILRKWRESQAEIIEFLGYEYQNFNLVIAQDNGRPVDQRMIEKDFNQLKTTAGLPNVVFHSLRHSSTTYKLKLNHGDLKATQGDTGHAEVDMITRIYAHILDEDRKINAQKFESSFYSNPDLRNVRAPEDPQPTIDVALLIQQLQNSPELANTLAALLPRPR